MDKKLQKNRIYFENAEIAQEITPSPFGQERRSVAHPLHARTPEQINKKQSKSKKTRENQP